MNGWITNQAIHVSERAGVGAENFPVSLKLDTARLIAMGALQTDGADLRVSVAGREVPCQAEAMGTTRTQITFEVDVRPNETREDIALHWGNPAAADPSYTSDWGILRPDGFENELLRVSYGIKFGTWGKNWGCQTEFTIREHDENQFGGDLIPESWAKSRNDVTYWEPDTTVPPRFEVEMDGPIYKRIRFNASEKLVEGKHRVTDLVQRVTFYRNCPFLHEEYENILGAVVDTAAPGGMRLRSKGRRNFDFVACNFDSSLITWDGHGEDKETRGGWTADPARAARDPRYRYLNDYAYHGHLILGVINLHNGRGIGTSARDVQTAFFVDWPHERAGYSLWPDRSHRLTRYLYYVERGRDEVVARGKLLANPPIAEFAKRPGSAVKARL